MSNVDNVDDVMLTTWHTGNHVDTLARQSILIAQYHFNWHSANQSKLIENYVEHFGNLVYTGNYVDTLTLQIIFFIRHTPSHDVVVFLSNAFQKNVLKMN